jgi:hypothetical protein
MHTGMMEDLYVLCLRIEDIHWEEVDLVLMIGEWDKICPWVALISSYRVNQLE